MTLPIEFVRHYPNCTPISWLLRERYKHIWFRIHSLPESKRYAETDDEFQELLRRHNELASDVIGEGSNILLFWHGLNPSGGIDGRKAQQYADGCFEAAVYVFSSSWRAHLFDEFIKCVADDCCSSSIFLAVESGNVYAPYDGGADVLVKDARKLQAMKTKYAKWSSKFKSGL